MLKASKRTIQERVGSKILCQIHWRIFIVLAPTCMLVTYEYLIYRCVISQISSGIIGSAAIMFSRLSQRLVFRNDCRGYKVAVLGASGGCGQAISLLLKMNPQVTHLSKYDIQQNTYGNAIDLSHINTIARVTGHVGKHELASALKDSEIVVIPAGISLLLGDGLLNRDSLFGINAGIVKELTEGIAQYCPKAMILVISNPVNSIVPVVAETMKRFGVYDPKRLFGVTTLDVVRANTFVAANQGTDVTKTNVVVIGGHGGSTILPLLSQVKGAEFDHIDIQKLTHMVKYGGDEVSGDEVVVAKKGEGSATLSLAFATVRFTDRLMRAMSGEKDIVECAYVQNELTASPFFSAPVLLGPSGVEEVLPIGPLSDFEQLSLDQEIPILCDQVKLGVDFMAQTNTIGHK